jgi:putative transposase
LFNAHPLSHINFRYDRAGPLFQGAFQLKHISPEDYYQQLMDYIHENPVKSELVEKPSDWLFSSIHDYIRKEDIGYFNIDLGATP